MSLTTSGGGGDGPRLPRVSPFVFKDATTQVVLETTKKSRARWLLIALISIGAVAALAILVFIFQSQLGSKQSELEHKTTEYNTQHLEDQNTISDLRLNFEAYRQITDLRQEEAQLRTKIQNTISTKRYVRLNPTQTTDLNTMPWENQQSQAAISALTVHNAKLKAISDYVDSVPPPAGPVARPSTPDQ